MFLVGTRKDHNINININSNSNSNTNNCNLNGCNIANLNECACNLAINYNNICAPDLQPYNFCRQGSNHYERLYNYNHIQDRPDLHRQSFRHSTLPRNHHYLPKSLSYAANIDRSPYQYPVYYHDYIRMPNPKPVRNNLRPSKSVPEGLARWEHCGSYRRPVIRNVQVIEQITTSV